MLSNHKSWSQSLLDGFFPVCPLQGIGVSILSKIRRWHFRDKLSIREIARRTGFSRNTVRRYLSDEISEPLYPKRLDWSEDVDVNLWQGAGGNVAIGY